MVSEVKNICGVRLDDVDELADENAMLVSVVGTSSAEACVVRETTEELEGTREAEVKAL